MVEQPQAVQPMPQILAPQAQHLAGLVGRWTGQGRGLWASPVQFQYGEEVVFEATGKPALTYRQRTWALDGGSPLHSEMGYLRAPGAGLVELLVVQPTGFAEVHSGTMSDGELALELVDLGRAPSALNVTGIARRWHLEADALTYTVSLAMNGEALAPHLSGELTRAS